jgi:hypothetical protein
MEFGDFMGLGLVVAGVIGVLGILGDAYKRRLNFKERELELFSQQTAEKAAQYAAQAERLEARVRVLERIATDKSADVALQIEGLRERQIN